MKLFIFNKSEMSVHTPLFFIGRLPPIFLRVVVMAVAGAVAAAAVTTDGRACTTDAIPPCQALLSTTLMYVPPANIPFMKNQFRSLH